MPANARNPYLGTQRLVPVLPSVSLGSRPSTLSVGLGAPRLGASAAALAAPPAPPALRSKRQAARTGSRALGGSTLADQALERLSEGTS
ncbi:uncharacterized protein CTHT_0011270 [Thermochaetoides thermophila DSM 1495]|uniref:Uncharacterized protein n=1 Tax=Chaetomium thermophilum (strain DSM 1495 / CBS 144.50 / IMI 039719) TaxID=759272 RepID=G0S0U5_CHATD|nr:hypothetical protein CTHT_0011270 [Thermochaetoides thermophila DSM 1495]EGS22655.1 hypothetical protein CTHT_0011270 [Thermochaetoides thermophila DSM 1495]